MDYFGMDVTPNAVALPAVLSARVGDDWTTDIDREFWDAAWTLDDEWQPHVVASQRLGGHEDAMTPTPL
jgi:hypothetical protein